jgi:hypothetical protein
MIRSCVVGLCALLIAAPAFAADVVIENRSKADLDHVYFSKAGENKFEKDLMEGAPVHALDAGRTFKVSGIDGGTYDVKVSNDEGDLDCVLKTVAVQPGKSVEVTRPMIDSCGG